MSTPVKIHPSATSMVAPLKDLIRPDRGMGPIGSSALAELVSRAATATPSLPTVVVDELAALSGGRTPSENPLNLVRVNNSTEIRVPDSFRNARVRLEVAGYSKPKLSEASGYNPDAVMRGIVARGGEGKVGLLVSPTADPGSIDASITKAALNGNLPLLSLTAEEYTKYINPENMDAALKASYLAQKKYVLPDAESYVKANAESSNSWLALGGGDVAAKAFRHHIELDHPIVLVDDARGPCLSVEGLRSENASSWLADKVARQREGRPLHCVRVAGAEVTYELGEIVALAKDAAVSAKKNGTTVRDELAKRSSLPPEVFADAMMFDKASLNAEWFAHNFDEKYDVRLSVLRLGPQITPEQSGAIAIDLLDAYLRRR